MKIRRVNVESDIKHYSIATTVSGECPLAFEESQKNTKNAIFKCGENTNNTFWIRPIGNDKYKIGYSNCPLYFRGDTGYIKNAEFRCGDDKMGDEFSIYESKDELGKGPFKKCITHLGAWGGVLVSNKWLSVT